MLGSLHHNWHRFGAKYSYLMSEVLLSCCYTAGHQDKIPDVTIRHSIIAPAFFRLENVYTLESA